MLLTSDWVPNPTQVLCIDFNSKTKLSFKNPEHFSNIPTLFLMRKPVQTSYSFSSIRPHCIWGSGPVNKNSLVLCSSDFKRNLFETGCSWWYPIIHFLEILRKCIMGMLSSSFPEFRCTGVVGSFDYAHHCARDLWSVAVTYSYTCFSYLHSNNNNSFFLRWGTHWTAPW